MTPGVKISIHKPIYLYTANMYESLCPQWTQCSPSFSPGRCASCGDNVVGEGTGCTAMDQVFHVDCFVCMTCSTKLRGKPFYAVEKKAYCEPCYIVSNRSTFFFKISVLTLRIEIFLGHYKDTWGLTKTNSFLC